MMLRKLLKLEQQYINYFFESLDHQEAEDFFTALLRMKGAIFCSGVGKSGFIAQKIAATMISTGTKALYIPPIDALHGDLGIVSRQDVFLLFSKSGETEELNNLIPYLKERKIPVFAISSNPDSTLRQFSDYHVTLPLERELCPFDLAPTTSTNLQLIFGDILTIALMRAHNFTLSAYAKNHPSGRIGKRATYKVKDLMLSGDALPTVPSGKTLLEATMELTQKRCGCVFITDPKTQKLLGVFTDGDLSRGLQKERGALLEKAIDDLMTTTVRVISQESLAWDALQKMEENPQSPITVLAVVDPQGTLIGAIKMHDILQKGIS